MNTKQILVLPHIKVNNANAWSSPYTSGFPSVCAFGGAVHALQRKFVENGFDNLEISGFSVISHKFSMRTYKESAYSDLSIIASANPLDKNGERPSFVPEIKCRMEISLLCELKYNIDDNEALVQTAKNLVNSNFRIASGDVQTMDNPYAVPVGREDQDKDFRRYIIRKLMPGYALIERRELMSDCMNQGHDALEALLDHLTVLAEPHINASNEKINIERNRKERGWLVPISTGYAAISNIGSANNQRSPDTPHRFAESMVTLGEFRMLHRIQNIDSLLWHGNYDAEKGMYCYNQESKEDDDDLRISDFV